ncbi:MAG: hypothetical protein IPG23_04585 [Burkholderiales bacterium]|jgi:hypothetical protein|nr:hypothetical protein [Burkholderiales bacterium]
MKTWKTGQTMHRFRIVGVCVGAAALLVACGGGDQEAAVGTTASGSAPLQVVRGVHPVVIATIDGKIQARMLIDTGASVTLLASNLVPRGRIVDICLTPTACVKNFPVDISASTYSNPKPGYYNGLIGWDLLSKLVTTIDYKNSRVSFGAPNTGSVVRYSLDTWGRPQAPILVAGKSMGVMLLDTGSSYVRVTDAQSQALGSAFVPSGREVSFTFNASETTTLSTPVPVCVGTLCAAQVILQKASWSAVGGSYFRNFNVTIDGPAGVFRLAQETPGVLISALSRYGIQLAIDDASRIVVVGSGSPADRAVIGTSDQLLSINGQSVDSLGYLGAMAILEDPSTTSIKLTLQGSGQTRDVTLQMSVAG